MYFKICIEVLNLQSVIINLQKDLIYLGICIYIYGALYIFTDSVGSGLHGLHEWLNYLFTCGFRAIHTELEIKV